MAVHDSERFAPLRRRDLDPDPLRQFEAWLAAAVEAGVRLPEAMTLATATRDGVPSARMVLLKGLDGRGFVFYTSYASRKGRELAENRRAAVVFYWDELGRQVRVEGGVEPVAPEESAAYFETRPPGHRLAAWASRQSEPIASRAALESEVERLRQAYAEQEPPPPPTWGGYRLAPAAIEFWQHRDDRLHDRFRYTRARGGGWLIERLSP